MMGDESKIAGSCGLLKDQFVLDVDCECTLLPGFTASLHSSAHTQSTECTDKWSLQSITRVMMARHKEHESQL